MSIDNQLILGVVFITAGIAMALLAYAAFLNRRTQASEDEEPAADAPEMAEPPPQDEELTLPHEAAQAEPAEVEPHPAAHELDQLPGETPAPAPSEATVPSVSASAHLRRDPDTGRLVIDVGNQTYRSMESLRSSEDWKSVDSLLSDLIAWLYKDTPPERPSQDRDQEGEPLAGGPLTMIEQINEVLTEKLAERSDLPQAVRMVEGTGGSIRVFIGVEGYALDEVPNEEIRTLIRQAVAEWESRT